MGLLEAIVLGIVEGITEYLPVSSTGHLILTSALLGLSERVDKQSLDAFNIVIQGGAILAVVSLYHARVWQMLQGVAGRDAAGRRLAINVVVAFLPSAILGVLLADTIQEYLFFPLPVLSALAVGGIAMLVISRWQQEHFHEAPAGSHDARRYVDLESLTLGRALAIGLLQCLAMWPGTSRSMVTIVGGMLVGMKPRHAAEFSFILGLPTLGGACVYSLAKNMMNGGPNMFETLGAAPLVTGLVVATVSAALAVKWLVAFLTRHGLAVFGWYRLALCAVLAVLIWNGTVTIAPDDAVPATPLASPDSREP